MNLSWLILGVVLAAFFQAVWVPFNWLMLVVVFLALLREGREVMLLAFLAGLVMDFISGGRLGLSSLLFLVVAGGVFWLRTKLGVLPPLAVSGMAFLADWVYKLFLFQTKSLRESLLFGLVSGMVYFFWALPRLGKSRGLKLKLD